MRSLQNVAESEWLRERERQTARERNEEVKIEKKEKKFQKVNKQNYLRITVRNEDTKNDSEIKMNATSSGKLCAM